MIIQDKLKEVQKGLDALPELYLSGYRSGANFVEWDLEEFILRLLVSLSQEHDTKDFPSGDVSSKVSRRRSLGDIYRICKHYYKGCTLYEVQLILSRLWKLKKIGFFYCLHNAKRVYMEYDYYKSHTVNPVQYADPDEYGITTLMIKGLSQKKD